MNNNITAEQVKAGQAVYTKEVLHFYDLIVHHISNTLIWKCPSKNLIEHRISSDNQLDVGVGTGFLLKHSREKPERLALMDLNPNTLEYARKRLGRQDIEVYQQNILEPITKDIVPFDLITMNYLLHCLPGTIETKAVVFKHLKRLAKPGCWIMGSTILSEGIEKNVLARKLMAFYNRKGIFCNQEDSLESLSQVLEDNFDKYHLRVEGCVALFSGRVDSSPKANH
ncbi:class I SAM-dependent methyltransferase [Endozoicomonas sp. Mp262]|uniref:class I SAM-dependent methyltransferase n=1 Tax=Endozoicomonas sp. Mp262 TaxID=2919499 RepID=UPI0021DB4558